MHAMACINFIRGKVEDYVHSYFKTEMWRRIFLGMIHAIPYQNHWPSFPDEELLQPPKVKKLPRRPHVHRRREPGPKIVQSATKKCSRCCKFGTMLDLVKGKLLRRPNEKVAGQSTVKVL